MMKLITHLYYVGQIITYGSIIGWALYMTIRGLFADKPMFINICFAAMALSSYYLLYAPSVHEYRYYKIQLKKRAAETK